MDSKPLQEGIIRTNVKSNRQLGIQGQPPPKGSVDKKEAERLKKLKEKAVKEQQIIKKDAATNND